MSLLIRAFLVVMVAGFALCSQAQQFFDTSKGLSSVPACMEKTVWDGKSQGFITVNQCSISCSGGSTSRTCRANEKCDCQCRSSGLPGCSCHPNSGVKQGEEKTVAANVPSAS